jgi:flavin reductase (DIM6/NTAB) family NADH-FMN oxidoreductase RutF
VAGDPAAGDTGALRKVLGRYATGVTIVTTRDVNERLVGVTSNSFASVSLDPPLILWSVARRARSFEAFTRSGHFVINVLAGDQAHISQQFAKPQADKFAGIAYRSGVGGCPVLTGTVAHFECRTEQIIDGGDHAIVVGRVLHAVSSPGEALVFLDGTYGRVAALVTPDRAT